MIQIRFCTGKDIVSDLIRLGERDNSWATHAEAVLSDGMLLGAHYEGGVMIRPAGYDKATTTQEMIVIVPANPEMTDKFYAFCETQVGKPYDATAIAGLALDRDWRTPDSWFCSELMAAALEDCGFINHLISGDNHISPADLLLILSAMLKL